MSKGRPRPAQTKKPKPPMSERLAGGDPWDRETKPDEDYRLLAKRPGMQMDDYVDFPGRAVGHEGEAIDEDSLREMAKANNRRFEQAHEDQMVERQAKVIADKVASIQREGAKIGLDFAPKLAAFIKEANSEIAAKRRMAA